MINNQECNTLSDLACMEYVFVPGTAGSSTSVLAGRDRADCNEAIRALAAWDQEEGWLLKV